MLGACGLVLAAGFALQLIVYGHGGTASLSDIPHLVLGHHLTPGHWPYVDRVLEYPVLAGVLLGIATNLRPGPFGALTAVAALASVVTLGITWLLAHRFGGRAWRWAIGTPVLLYAFQNWDVFAIAALVIGLLAFERGHDRGAGVAFGIGAATKIFPLVVVPPLAALRWVRGDHQGARRLVGASVLTFAAVNAPFAIVHPGRWWWTYSFQSARPATWGSAWFYALRVSGLPVHGPTGATVANMVTLIALLGGLAWLVVRAAHVDLDPFAAAGAAVAICILADKIYSPTYDIWLVVVFVTVPLGRRLWLAFCAVDLAVYAVVYGSFDGPLHVGVVRTVLPVLVVLRTAVLLTVVVRTTRAPRTASSGAPALTASG
jgi:hypothetical protein